MRQTIIRLCESIGDLAAEIGMQAEALDDDEVDLGRAALALFAAQRRLEQAQRGCTDARIGAICRLISGARAFWKLTRKIRASVLPCFLEKKRQDQ